MKSERCVTLVRCLALLRRLENGGQYLLPALARDLNDGNVERRTMDRLDSFIDGMAGKRLTYKALIQ